MPAADRADVPPPPHIRWADLALLLLSSRLSLLTVGFLSTFLLASGLTLQKGNLVYHPRAPLPLEIWARWDAEWYLLIADRGYDVAEQLEGLPLPYEREAAAGFLPLYPLLIRLLSPLLGGVGAGVLISNLCLAGALPLLYRTAEREAGGAARGRAGLAACAALLVFPMSLFLSAVYAESLLLVLSLAAFESARRGRFALAGVAGGLAALTRPFGVLLAVPIAWEWAAARRQETGRPAAAAALWALAPPAALAGFMAYCGQVFGDPFAFLQRQTRWRGGMSGPWRAFTRWVEEGPAAHGAHDSTLELGIAVCFLAMLPFIVRRLRPSLAIYAVLGVLIPLGSTLWSFGRLALTIFPAFVLIGVAWSQGRRRLPAAYAFLAATLSGLLMALYATWWWAG